MLKDKNSLEFFTSQKNFFHVGTVPQIGYEIICIKVVERFKWIKIKKDKKESIYCTVKKGLALWRESAPLLIV